MLRAEQAALEQHGKAELLRILEREFQYYKSSFDSVGTQAALMAGFTVAVLVTLITDNEDLDPNLVKTYHILAFVCLMSLIFTIVSVTTVVVWGPQLALRGASPTAMETAVRGVKGARWEIYISFFLGVITFLLMTVTVAWIQMKESVATICSGVAFLTMVLIFRNGYVTKMTFRMMPSAHEHSQQDSDAGSSTRDSAVSSGVVTTEQFQTHHRNPWARPSHSSRQPLMEDEHHTDGTGTIRRSSTSMRGSMSFVSTNTPTGISGTAQLANRKSDTNTIGGSGGGPINRESNLSQVDTVDTITTQLLNHGGGWLLKKGQRFGGEQWKKRWVSIHKGSLHYDKTRPFENNKVSPNSKSIPLSKAALGMGSDGKTIRITSSALHHHDGDGDNQEPHALITDWRCESSEERDAWIVYIKSGISQII